MKLNHRKIFFLAAATTLVLTMFLQSCQPSLPSDIEQLYPSLPEKVDFNFHIRPILSDRCYKCHGPDDNTREAGLRLDLEEDAFAKLESGNRALVKGKLKRSEAWKRIISDDPELQMPPANSNLSLSANEKALITKWIDQGAEWAEHWAFTPPTKIGIDTSDEGAIDYFISQKLEEKGLTFSPPTDNERLIRRVSMDLTGLPPSLETVDQFLNNDAPDAYEQLVDQLLDSDAYAERMAMEWLDVARFGDTHGLHLDGERFNWPWRDWVIRSFKQNRPYNDFITWQIAGDLLPNATREQKLATAFHRNHPASAEGGIPDEEYRQKYVQDRTNTTATAFLGLTLECATCHDHKFDPISQKEYYEMSAFFNNLKEVGMVNEFKVTNPGIIHASGPTLLMPSQDTTQQLSELKVEIEQVRKQLELTHKEVQATKEFISAVSAKEIKSPKPSGTYPFESIQTVDLRDSIIHRIQNRAPIDKIVDGNRRSLACGNPELVEGRIGKAFRLPNETDLVFLKDIGSFELYQSYSAGAWIKTEKEGKNQSILGTSGELGSAWRGWDLYLDTLSRPSVKLVSIWPQNYMQITAKTSIAKDQWQQIYFTYDGSGTAAGISVYINGQKVESVINYDKLYGTLIHRWRKRKQWKERPVMVGRSGRFHTGESGVFKGTIDEVKIFKQYLSPLEMAALYASETKEPLPQSTNANQLSHYLHRDHDSYKESQKQLKTLLEQQLELYKKVPEIMVLEEQAVRRKTYILNRGQYNEPTQEVFPATPKKVLAFPDDLSKDRLGLAQWLCDKNNPLTARVAVNRYWQLIFGRGIVETAHDFGKQGALPSHPDLLDWLAVDFMESGWNVKALLRKMVLSATYRQSSIASAKQLELDAKNIFLSRAPSYRLQAEMIRDNALAASGLLSHKIGGPSVKPYQPGGIWEVGGLVSGNYNESIGNNLYRRSMYTYVRRTSPHPAMVAFDAPNRLVCTIKRELTNTPLQALVLLNDPQFVEASRVLAQRIQKEGGESLESRSTYAFRLLCGRPPKPQELDLLKQQYDKAFAKFKEQPKSAKELLQVGKAPFDESLNKIETAALAIVASTIMNFDEAYMKR